MTNKNLPANQKQTVKSLLANINYKKRFEEVLKEKAGPFMASLSQLTNSSKQLSKCDPHSIIASAFTAACLDLPIDKNLGFAHIVPYGEVAQFQMGWKGFVQLALRTGQYSAMNAIVVNKEAFISYNPLTGDLKIDADKLDEYSDNIVGYAFYFRLVSGFEKTEFWTLKKVQSHATKYSQAYKKGMKQSPWFTDPNGMGIKTVVKNVLNKWGILSIEMRNAIDSDQSAKRNIDSDAIYPDNTDIIEPEFTTETIETNDKETEQPKEEKKDNKIDYDLFIQIAMKDDPENFEKALSINGITTSDVKNMKDIQKEGVYGTYKKLISK